MLKCHFSIYRGCGKVTHFFCRGKQQTQSVVLGEFPATPLHARGLPITGIINEPSWSVSPDHIAKMYCTSQKQHRLEPFQIAPSFTLSLFFPGSALAGRQARALALRSLIREDKCRSGYPTPRPYILGLVSSF